jgi:predicted transcriptional regulator
LVLKLPNANTDEERLSDLHFQLQGEDRRRIITELQIQELKISEVAKKLDITATEAFRQLQRMTEGGLLEKTVDGKYRATPYSRLILESSAAMGFLSKHREYFLEHDASLIPMQFRLRFGELSKAVLITEMVVNINKGSEVLRSAEKFINVMGEQRLEGHVQTGKERALAGVRVRTLLQEDVVRGVSEERMPSGKAVERRVIPRVCAVMIMTEKIAGMVLPRLDGKMDYQVLTGSDPDTMRWAGDLFEDQWGKGRPWP